MEIFYYLFEVSFLTVLFYGVYFLLFRNETFFRTNRYILLLALVSSFLIPLINIPINSISGSATLFPGFSEIPSLAGLSDSAEGRPSGGITRQAIYIWIYLSGLAFMMIRSFYHACYLSLIRYRNPSVRKDNFRLIMTDRIPSFSFFRWIFIQKDADDQSQQDVVIRHELAHSRQLHSADLIILEIIQAVLWFNPFIQLYKKSAQETHEFLADRDVLNSGTNLKDYVDTIVQEIMHNHSYRLASHLKSSTLKKRVIMATKNSSKKASWKYMLILPALVLGLLSFSFTSNQSADQEKTKKNPPSMWPINKADIKKISKDFGGTDAESHPGIDFAAKPGTPIMATASGKVKTAKAKGDYGNIVFLTHGGHF